MFGVPRNKNRFIYKSVIVVTLLAFVLSSEAQRLTSNSEPDKQPSLYLRNDPNTSNQSGQQFGYIFSNMPNGIMFQSSTIGIDANTAVGHMVITNAGYVGIGTSSPSQKLQVNGSFLVSNGSWKHPLIQPGRAATAGNVGYSFHGDTDTGMFNPNTDNTISFATSGQERVRVNSSGNVGIGNLSPEFALNVSRANHNVARFKSTATNSGADVLIVDADNNDGRASLQIQGNNGSIESFFVSSSGHVGIGTTFFGSHKLAVEGTIGAREIKVEATGWSDFVFENNYDLPTLEEVANHISQKGHLPEIPSAAEVKENGINLGEMDAKLLQKIEELTLYMIDMNKRMKQLEKENSALRNELSSLKK